MRHHFHASRNSSTDSTELLLDTICNTFGSVMFLAMTVIILTAFTRVLPDPMPATAAQLQQIRELQAQIASLQSLSSAPAPIVLSTPPLWEAAAIELEHLRQEGVALLRNLERNIQEAQNLEAQNRRLRWLSQLSESEQTQQLDLLKEKIHAVQTQTPAPALRTLQLHAERPTELQPYWLILHQDTLSVLGSNAMIFPNGATHATQEISQDVALEVHPDFYRFRPQRGIRLRDNPHASEELTKLFQKIDADRYFPSILATTESFESLRALREALRTAGRSAHWEWVRDETDFVLVPSPGKRYEAGR